jgi:hypothetical protein
VLHYPPGTSKWNRIEHKLFSQISINWRGRPLTSYETIISLIAATTTSTGMKVYAQLDKRPYPTRIEVTDEQLAAVNIARHTFHGEWIHRPYLSRFGSHECLSCRSRSCSTRKRRQPDDCQEAPPFVDARDYSRCR